MSSVCALVWVRQSLPTVSTTGSRSPFVVNDEDQDHGPLAEGPKPLLSRGPARCEFVTDRFAKDFESFFVGRDLEYLDPPSEALRAPGGALPDRLPGTIPPVRRLTFILEDEMTETTTRYGVKRTLTMDVEEADRRIREELSEEGFGILTEIDVRKTLKEKLDEDFRPYRILGACNPPLALQALEAETDVGLLLPCNVIVYEGDDEGTSVVAVIDPVVQLGVAGRNDLEPLAREVRERMERALSRV